MTRSGLIIVAILASGLGFARPAQAAVPKVNDQAGFFSKSAIDQATATLQDIQRRYKVEVVVETFPSIPQDMRARFDSAKPEAEKNRFFQRWAEIRASDEGVKGVYVLICKSPGHLQIEPDESVRRKAFTLQERDALVPSVLSLLKAKRYDAALEKIVGTISATVTANESPVRGRQPAPNQAPAGLPAQINSMGSGIGGWLCLAVVAVLVIWMIMGLIRAFSGRSAGGYGGGPGGPGGMPGGGYGQGGYGPGYGGGGGGGF